MQAALARVEKTGESIEEAAKATGVTAATVHAHKSSKAAKVSPPGSSAPSSPPAPATSPASPHVPAPGVAVSGRPDVLELVRRILDARNAAARAELDEGLRVFATEGDPALVAWLARPIDAVEIGDDELDVLREGLGFALGVARKAEAGGAQLRALGIVDRLGKSVSVVQSRRPREEGPDKVEQRLCAVRDQAIARMGILTSAAAVKLAVDRQELGAWATANLGPLIGAEVVRRVDAMLGGPPS